MKKMRLVISQKDNDANDFGPFAPDQIETQFAEFMVGRRRALIRGLSNEGVETQGHGKSARRLRQLMRKEARRQQAKDNMPSRTQRSRIP